MPAHQCGEMMSTLAITTKHRQTDRQEQQRDTHNKCATHQSQGLLKFKRVNKKTMTFHKVHICMYVCV